MESYTIAFTLRCGSNALCDVLGRNGFGRPTEYWQYPYAANPHFERFRRLPDAEAVERLIDANTSNDIFASKITHDQRSYLDETLAASGRGPLEDYLPNHRWIWLRRRDVIGQTISLFRAQQSGEWLRVKQDVGAPDAPSSYDFFALLSNAMILSMNELAWSQYFRRREFIPPTLFYEDICLDVEAALQKIAVHIGRRDLLQENFIAESNLAIQRDSTTEEIRDRFVKDIERIGSNRFSSEMGPQLKCWREFFQNRMWNAS